MKRLITLLSTIIISATCIINSLTSFALGGTEGYDLNNEAYIEKINSYYEFPHSEELVQLLMPHTSEYTFATKHIYAECENMLQVLEVDEKIVSAVSPAVFEQDFSNNGRVFYTGTIDWTRYRFDSIETASSFYISNFDSINAFLKDNNLKAQFVTSPEDVSEICYSFNIAYNNDVTLNDIIEIALALNNEYDISPSPMMRVISEGVFYNEPEIGTPTIIGDADLNGEVAMADAVTIAKYLTNSKIYPLSDSTAFANADVNGDNVIDNSDTSKFIEYFLNNISYEEFCSK